jgi:dephospho-CoA kinase
MYVIGLTGNIATGKSTVARLLRACGAEVIDADRLAHALMAPGTPVWQAIRRTFGPGVIAPDGMIDRRTLGRVVFGDPRALARLEAIVHPAVGAALQERLQELQGRPQPPPVVVVEAIKLVESGLTRLCDALWLVVAPREVQLERLVRRRGLTPAEADVRIDAQPPAEPKRALASVVLENAGSLENLRRQVWQAWERSVKPCWENWDEGPDPHHRCRRRSPQCGPGPDRGL